MEVELRAIERTVALIDLELLADALDRIGERAGRNLPVRLGSQMILRHRGQLDRVGQLEEGVDLIKQTGNPHHLVGDLILRQQNVRVVLCEAAHPEHPVQRAAELMPVDKPQLAVQMCIRDRDITGGTIKVGGVDIATVDPEVLLTDYSMVFQDVVLFDDTVMENIRLGRRGASDAEVIAAARAANCEEFVSKLPQGYQTPIGENGAKLSGGERQRISIARALLKNAPIVLLDEATASLDVENETKVQGALSRLLAGKTVLVIAHRMRTVAGADHIVVLKDGKVAQQGSPQALMAEGGLFRHMVELQSESAQWQLSGARP